MLATAFIFGQGIIASLWLLLALIGWFSPLIVAGISLVCVLGGLFLSRLLFMAFGRQVLSIWRELGSDSWGWQGIAGLTALLCLAWVTSIGRPFYGDATAFYMALPKVIAASHRLVPLPGYEGYTNIGLQGELHYSVFMMLNSPDAARLFVWQPFCMLCFGHVGKSVGRRGHGSHWHCCSLLQL
jgi:hypothetical protein